MWIPFLAFIHRVQISEALLKIESSSVVRESTTEDNSDVELKSVASTAEPPRTKHGVRKLVALGQFKFGSLLRDMLAPRITFRERRDLVDGFRAHDFTL